MILAGTSIAMLTGDNGIIRQAQNAKNNSAKAEFEEKVKLAVTASRTNEEGKIDLEELETELKNAGMTNIEKNGPNEGLPWLVKEKGYIYEIKEDGTVEAKSGVSLSRTTLKLLAGRTYKLEVSKTEEVKETAKWSTSNAAVATVDQNGNVTAVGKVGDTAEITVEIGNHSDKCTVTIVSEVTEISAEAIEVAVGETKPIVVKTTPSGEVEDLTYSYSSGDTSKLTVEEKTGRVKGVASGEVVVTITGTKQNGRIVTTTCAVTVNVKKNPTVADIIANKSEYYGKVVTNYTAGGVKYRIFYVEEDQGNGKGKYGPANTIYLKADYDSSKTLRLDNYANYNKTTTKVKEMNPDWAKTTNRGNSESSWNANEQAAAWLCTPSMEGNEDLPWSSYYDGTKANYVIGGPSAEMYCDSYNSVSHAGVTNYTLGAKYSETQAPGYVYTVNGESPGAGYDDCYTGKDTVDYKNYGSMYCGYQGSKGNYWWWIASPSSHGTSEDQVCVSSATDSYLIFGDYIKHNYSYVFCPLVSLRSDFKIQIEK
ncbi:MAG: hypothetical protein HFJ55_01910 [Clostridia bacterium]|nr:hypothetical protein [Clostridia bacterium]